MLFVFVRFVVFTLFLNTYIYTLVSIFAALILVGFINADNETSEYKVIWIVTILLLPVFGVALYIQLKTTRGSKRQRKRFQNVSYLSYKALEQNPETIDGLNKYDAGACNYSKYLLNTEKWPVYNDTTATYLKDGETYFEDLFASIKDAKKYILLEYFIVKPGKVWKQLFDILRAKAREGVEIKLLYDDFGCADRFDDKKFFKKLSNHGIEAVPFNKLVPTINMFSQYRDHRKVVVIDGCIGYVGGINIGDEYANESNKFGHWKDTAVKLNGPAVWSLAVMFFNNWQVSTKKIIDITYTPDFCFDYNNLFVIIEAKGIENDVFPIKKKMFRKYLETCKKPVVYFEIYSKKQLLQAIEIIKGYE